MLGNAFTHTHPFLGIGHALEWHKDAVFNPPPPALTALCWKQLPRYAEGGMVHNTSLSVAGYSDDVPLAFGVINSLH